MSIDLSIEIYADGALADEMIALKDDPLVRGFTTNPTLMRASGVTDYKAFADHVLKALTEKPISFEVFADDLNEMERQARLIASWGSNVNIKIPVTNTKGIYTGPVIHALSCDGISVNVTAVFTNEQVAKVAADLSPATPSIISVFAGRIADSGRDPVPFMTKAKDQLAPLGSAKLLWASPREVYNIVQADKAGVDIITLPAAMIKKMALFGKDLDAFSLETVDMFYKDATAAGYSL